MMAAIKIHSLQIENTKRVKAVHMTPAENGLTVIGGRNGQGKTSVLDAIAWALGGNKFRPGNPQYDGSTIPPEIKIRLNNGLIVERKGKNSSLTVTDPSGAKAGQQLLDSFIGELALDLPRFMQANDREKAETLLQILGVGPQLAQMEMEEKKLYNERLTVGRTADQKAKFAAEMPWFDGMPDEPVSPMELIRQQQEILAQNGENARKRSQRDQLERDYAFKQDIVAELRRKLQEAEEVLQKTANDLSAARMDAMDLQDQSTAGLEASIANIEEINRKIRANLDKEKAQEDARNYSVEYQKLSVQIDEIRSARMQLLKNANLPLPELTVLEGKLMYKGQPWDCMSSADQLKVATAIVRRLNPNCGFVLMDKLEQMDPETLRAFGTWLESEGLQVIATRVSTDRDECQIIIEDGRSSAPDRGTAPSQGLAPSRSAAPSRSPAPLPEAKDNSPSGWKAGEF